MNCDEYLRKLHENPRSADPDMDEHASDCEACRQQRDALLAFEESLRGALQLETAGAGVQSIYGGEISLRRAP